MQNDNSQLRNVCFTINNPTTVQLAELFEPDGRIQFAVWQLEAGERGTQHLQGYLEAKDRIRFNQLRELLGGRVHLERRRGSQAQAIAYCKKEETRVDGPWEFGEPKRAGKRSDIHATMEAIAEGSSFDDLLDSADGNAIKYSRGVQLAISRRDQKLRSESIRNLEVHVLWGDPGTGKTRSVYDEHGFQSVYTLTTSANGAVWFDGYDGQEILLIDDFRGFIPFQFFLKILDIYPLRLDIKGSFTYAAWKKVYITSNHPVQDWYRSDANHCIAALERRITHTIHYSSDNPWSIAAAASEPPRGGEWVGDAFLVDGLPVNAESSDASND